MGTGEFDDGFFPTDLDLSETYQVSRHTVREAVRHLNSAGILKRERGRGTVVNRAEFEQSLGTLYSLFQSVEASGVTQTSKVLRLEVATNPVAAGFLKRDETAELVLIERLRLADDSPLAIDTVWLPRDIAHGLLEVDWSHTALYDELAKIGSPVPNQGWEKLSPVVPDAAESESLDLKPGEAAFHLERLGCHNETAIEWRSTIVRGDRYRFVAEWSAGMLSTLKPSRVD